MKRAALLPLVFALAIPGAAGATTVSGSLAGAKLPKKGKGVVTVRALNVATGAVGGAKRTRTGAFSLQLTPATYLVIGSIVPRRGKSTVSNTKPLSVRVTKKPKRKLKVRFKKRKHGRHKAKASNTPGVSVDVDYPAVWVKRWDVSAVNAEFRVMSKGMQDMLITDLVALGPPTCANPLTIVDRDAWDILLQEQHLQQSPAFDQSTAVPTGHLIEPNVFVTGRMHTDGDKLTLDAQIENTLTHRTFTTSVAGSASRLFDLEQELAGKLGGLLCNPPPPATDVPPPLTCGLTRQVCSPPPAGPPKAYAGSVSGSQNNSTTGVTIAWTGTVTMTYTDRHNTGQGDAPPGDYWYFAPSGGGLHVTLDKASTEGDPCVWHGETDVNVAVGQGEQSSVRADSSEPEYFLQGGFGPGDQIPFTGAGSTCDGSGNWPLYGYAYLFSVHAQKSSSTSLTGNASLSDPYTANSWNWSLGPQY